MVLLEQRGTGMPAAKRRLHGLVVHGEQMPLSTGVRALHLWMRRPRTTTHQSHACAAPCQPLTLLPYGMLKHPQLPRSKGANLPCTGNGKLRFQEHTFATLKVISHGTVKGTTHGTYQDRSPLSRNMLPLLPGLLSCLSAWLPAHTHTDTQWYRQQQHMAAAVQQQGMRH